MPRKKRPLDRESGVLRDASLIVIASEDRYAVKHYFARFKTRRVQISVIPTEDCRSAPNHVLARLERFTSEYGTQDGDTFWLCIDRDRWDERSLLEVLRECIRKKYGIALSNPCFELWILLHYKEFDVSSLQDSKSAVECLQQLLGGYGKRCCDTLKVTGDMVAEATERARAMDDSNDLLPNAPCTRIYKILDELRARDSIVFE